MSAALAMIRDVVLLAVAVVGLVTPAVPADAAVPWPEGDECLESLRRDLGPAVTVIDGLCLDGWAYVDSCPDCGGDTQQIVHFVGNRWEVAVRFPVSPDELCRSDALAADIPRLIVDRVNWPCDGGMPEPPAIADEFPLRVGSKGRRVAELQRMLGALGFAVGPSGVDGHFGPDTRDAVIAWQQDAGLANTGEVYEPQFDHMVAMTREIAPAAAPAVPIELSGSGLGRFELGAPTPDVIEALTQRLGAPGLDSGWTRFHLAPDEVDPASAEYFDLGRFYLDAGDNLSDAWDYRYHRVVCWNLLCVHFGGDTENDGLFRGWELGAHHQVAPPTDPRVPALPAAELEGTNIRLGSSWAEFQAAFPAAVAGCAEGGAVAIDNEPWDGIFNGVWSWMLSGTCDFERPTYAPPEAIVIRMSAGDGPEPGCC